MKDETSINNFFLSDGQTAMPKLTHGSLFSGIGGFDLAAEWMGWENIFHCEINLFGQKILKYYWPNAISYADITKTDFSIHRGTIDILTGGFPCQPYSVAGKRKGKEDDRHLWPEMLRTIREIAPRYIVGENVGGLVSWNGGLVFNEVQTDLEAEGYEVQPVILPACAINAPHRRDRVWFIAHTKSERGSRYTKREEQESTINGKFSCDGLTTNTRLQRQEECEKQTARIEQCNKGHDAHTDGQRLWGQGDRIGKPRLFSKDSEGNYWQDFPTQPPICSGDDGLPTNLDSITFSKWRNESIKAYGNAIVPQVAYQIFTAINFHLSGAEKKIINTVPTAHTNL